MPSEAVVPNYSINENSLVVNISGNAIGAYGAAILHGIEEAWASNPSILTGGLLAKATIISVFPDLLTVAIAVRSGDSGRIGEAALKSIGTMASARPMNAQMTYWAVFRTELDEAAVADIRLGLGPGQPLGNNRFSASLCDAAGVRRTQARRGRPVKSIDEAANPEEQTGFGFR